MPRAVGIDAIDRIPPSPSQIPPRTNAELCTASKNPVSATDKIVARIQRRWVMGKLAFGFRTLALRFPGLLIAAALLPAMPATAQVIFANGFEAAVQ